MPPCAGGAVAEASRQGRDRRDDGAVAREASGTRSRTLPGKGAVAHVPWPRGWCARRPPPTMCAARCLSRRRTVMDSSTHSRPYCSRAAAPAVSPGYQAGMVHERRGCVLVSAAASPAQAVRPVRSGQEAFRVLGNFSITAAGERYRAQDHRAGGPVLARHDEDGLSGAGMGRSRSRCPACSWRCSPVGRWRPVRRRGCRGPARWRRRCRWPPAGRG